jgi:PAS domain-containing protein
LVGEKNKNKNNSMEFNIASIETIGKVLGVLATLGGSIWGIYSKIYKPYRTKKKEKLDTENNKKAMELQQYNNMVEMLSQLAVDVKLVKGKIFPNGGTSIFDGIGRLEKNVERISEKIDSLEDTQRIVLNMQKVAFWTSDKEGAFTYVSPALCRFLNRVESELLGNNWISCLVKTDTERISNAWYDSIEDMRTFDEIFSFSNGKQRDIKVHALAFHKLNKKGEYIGTYGTVNSHEAFYN